ncbi:MAG: NfeD family protein [Desulfobacterales bacterium]|nr:NfeD family protein [Desulfobacterales bacterium]
MQEWQAWITLGIILVIVEIFTPGFVLASFGVACMAAGIIASIGFSFNIQLIFFSIITLLIFFTIRPLFNRFFYKNSKMKPTGVDALLSKKALVIEKINNVENRGRIKIGGETWRALSETEKIIDIGALVIIKKIEGTTAFVEKKEEENR